MRLGFLLTGLLFFTACVKQGPSVSKGEAVDGGGTTGTTSGGTTTGSPSTGSDPLASEAWHLENTGQTSFSEGGGVAGEDISLKEVHSTLNILGRGIRIAVSDSGTQITHPDLSGNALSGEHRNYIFPTPTNWYNASPQPSGNDAHGTAVAGLVSAVGWNGIGSRGVAPSSKFAAFKFVVDYPDTETEESYLAKQIDTLYGNFDIFNMSYGVDGRAFFAEEPTVEDALIYGVTELRNGKGSLYIQSAGNSFEDEYTVNICDPICADRTLTVSGNTNAHSELATPYKIVVGAVNALGERASYSTPGSSIWVSAPGGEYGITEPAMITTDIQGCNVGYSYSNINFSGLFDFGQHLFNPRCDYTNRMNGTSSAAPVVSGVVALMLEANPLLSWRDVKHILAETADKVDFNGVNIPLPHPNNEDMLGHDYDYKWIQNKAGKLFSNWYGFGRVNAQEAVEMALTYNLSSLGNFEQTKHENGSWYYDSGEILKEIFDANPSTLEDSIWVGHNFVIENVQIEITTDHPFPGDLSIVLESPGQTESRLLTLNNKIYAEGGLNAFTMSSNAFYGESSEGFWTLKLVDGDNLFGSGDLLRWKILINGHRKSTDLSKPYPPTFITFSANPSASDKTPLFNFSNSDSHLSLLRYEASVERASDGTIVKDWTSLGLESAGHQFSGLTLVSGERYYIKIRAVSSGGVSSVQLKEWVAI